MRSSAARRRTVALRLPARIGRKTDTRPGQLDRVLSGRSSGFHRKTCVPPGVKSAPERPDILVPQFLKFLRQTGAGSFVRSSTVRDYCPLLGFSRKVLSRVVEWYSNGSRYFRVGLLPRLRIPGVDNRDVFARVHSSFQFLYAHPMRIGHKTLLNSAWIQRGVGGVGWKDGCSLSEIS
jgi:hypothetical protein